MVRDLMWREEGGREEVFFFFSIRLQSGCSRIEKSLMVCGRLDSDESDIGEEGGGGGGREGEGGGYMTMLHCHMLFDELAFLYTGHRISVRQPS
jgi:hypothetical protein